MFMMGVEYTTSISAKTGDTEIVTLLILRFVIKECTIM